MHHPLKLYTGFFSKIPPTLRSSEQEKTSNRVSGTQNPGFKTTVRAANKPNSVPNAGCPGLDNDHSSMDARCRAPLATYPGAWTGRSQTLPYLVLHRVGFTKLPRSPRELVRSYRTFSPLPRLNTGRYIFCCTFLHVAATSRYEAPCPMVFGLSSGFFWSSDHLGCSDRIYMSS